MSSEKKQAPTANPGAKAPLWKRRWFQIVAAIVVLMVIVGSCVDTEDDKDATKDAAATSEVKATEDAKAAEEARASEERERKEAEESEAREREEREKQEQEERDKGADKEESDDVDVETYGKDFEAWWLEQNGASSWDDIAARYPGGWEGHVMSVTSSEDTLFIITNLAKTGDGKDLAKQARDSVTNVVSFDPGVPASVKGRLEFIQVVNPQKQVLSHGGLEYAD